MRSSFLILSILFLGYGFLNAQKKDEPIKVIEFSGKIVYDNNGNPEPLAYTNVAVKGIR